ncbi:MAG: hypothetical protein EA377_10685 [Phycisphaerales bacterium]|nr:MAG: hypothetical protein EA377_10685 [Phycisphaerales bacterium]
MNGTDASFVTEFVRTLDRNARLILMLHYAEGLTTNEIALVLELTEEEVVARLEEVRTQTREAVQQQASTA